jgi:hypothetical protein
METLPKFKFLLQKQGYGSVIEFPLAKITNDIRLANHNYSIGPHSIKFWSLNIVNYMILNESFKDYKVYHICLQIPDSHKYLGLIENYGNPILLTNKLILTSSGVSRSKTLTSSPYLNSFASPTFLFSSNGNTFLEDKLQILIYDQNGGLISNPSKFSFNLCYKEYISFNTLSITPSPTNIINFLPSIKIFKLSNFIFYNIKWLRLFQDLVLN